MAVRVRSLGRLVLGLVLALLVILIITAIAVHIASSKKATRPEFSSGVITASVGGHPSRV
jgi:hypothetical protein